MQVGIEPLRYPENWPVPSRLERLLLWIPIAGWIFGAILEHYRLKPFLTAIHRQFDSRPKKMPKYWDDPERTAIALAIIDSCVQASCWPHSHFMPEDSLGVMIEARTGNGCEWDAQFRIEKALGVKPSDAEWQQLGEMSFGEAVDFFAQSQMRV